MKFLVILSCTTSLFFSFVSHPLIMIVLISTQALMVCLMITLSSSSSWFSFILFLVFMGGLMVLFIYVASLASNENFSTNLTEIGFLPGLFIPLGIFVLSMMNWQLEKTPQLETTSLIFKIYTPSIMYLTILCMVYLLLVLVVIVNITSLKEGSLRTLN